MKKRIFPNHKYFPRFHAALIAWSKNYPDDKNIRRRVNNIREQYGFPHDFSFFFRSHDEKRVEAVQRIRSPYLFDNSCFDLGGRELSVVERTKNQFRFRKKFQVPSMWKEKIWKE